MSRLSIRGWTLSAALWFFTAIFAPWSAIEAQVASGEPRIQHAALNCIPLTEFVYIQALIDPTNEIRAARVYFRAEQHSIFYYVDMTPSGGLFEALLPRPAESTQAVRYYVEARTAEDGGRDPFN